jgi:hypothetical protein
LTNLVFIQVTSLDDRSNLKLFYYVMIQDPNLMSFSDGDLKGAKYEGGRDYDSLRAFIEETLEVKCDVKNPTGCTDKEKGYIEKMSAKASDDRVKQIERLEKMAGDSMKAELKVWLRQRLHILRSLEA